MPKKLPPMAESKIRSLRHVEVNGQAAKKPWFVGHVDGLALLCRPPKFDEAGKPRTKFGPRSWVLFYRIEGQAKLNQPLTKGLGGYPSTSTAEAVRKAREWRSKLSRGIDPREDELEKINRRKRRQQFQTHFSAAAKNWRDFQISKPNRSSQDYLKKFNAVKRHIFPILGKRPIGKIEFEEVVQALRTIWEAMPPTAWKIQGAMRQIFEHAGLKDDQNVARWKNNLDQVLPHPDEFHSTRHMPSLHWRRVPEFVEKLDGLPDIGAKALILHILTVGRSETTCLAEWEQFDFENKVWNRPKEIMKAVQTKKGSIKYPHTQPISDATIEFLLSLKGQQFAGGFVSQEGLIFRAEKGGRIYDDHMGRLIPKLGYSRGEFVPHGFRASFKSWSLDDPLNRNFGELITEKCMSHQIGDEARNSYARTDFVRRRRLIMDEWSKHCFSGKPQSAKVSCISEATV